MLKSAQNMGHELAEQLCDVQDAVRINLEMISDQMTQSDLGSREEMLRAQERIIVLANHAKSDLRKLLEIASDCRGKSHA